MENLQDIAKEKKEIRKKIKKAAGKISKEILNSRSILIEQNLYTLSEYTEAKTLHIYISSFQSEINTFPIIEKFLNKGGKVIVPVVDDGRNILLHSELKSLERIARSRLNVWEPEEKYLTEPDNADLIIVPGIAFDVKGNRVGHGEGFYDRLLVNINSPKMALAFDFQISDKIPAASRDIPMDIIVSEDIIIRTR